MSEHISVPLYPAPTLEFQGGAASVLAQPLTLGSVVLGQPSAHAVGWNCSTVQKEGVEGLVLRPVVCPLPESEDPYNYVAYYLYDQNGIGWDTVFALKADETGGVLGVAAALDVHSTYPDLDMSMNKFQFNQPGIGIQMRTRLPADYQARIGFKLWVPPGCKPTIDGWLSFEVFYVKRVKNPSGGYDEELVNTNTLTCYPSL